MKIVFIMAITIRGWDIDTSDRTQRESDGGHIPGRYQWEETVDVSKDDETDQKIKNRV